MRKTLSVAALGVMCWVQTFDALSFAHAQTGRQGETQPPSQTPTQERTPSDLFAEGTAAFAEGAFARALEDFEAALAAGLDGPAVHYNIGVCRYKLGLYSEARAAFESIADRYPAMRGVAEYNLGLVAARQGDRARAEAHYRTALERSDDETIRYLARQQLGLPDEQSVDPTQGREWLALVDAQLGYDDNVLLLADEITLPDGQSAESRFVELWALLSGPLAESGFRLDGNIYALRYPEASIFDQSVLQLGVPYEWTIGSWHGEAGPQLSWTTIDGDLLDRRVGIGVRASREIAPGTTLGFRYVRDDVDEGDSKYAFIAGDRDWLEARLDRRRERGRLTLAYGTERNDRAAASVSRRSNKLSVRYRYGLSADWLIDVQASLRDSRYAELAVPRDEDLKEISVAATRTLPEGWLLNASLTSGDNDSDVATVSYRRTRVAVGVTKQF